MAVLAEAPPLSLLRDQTQERAVQAFHQRWLGAVAVGHSVQPPAEIKPAAAETNILTKIHEARTKPEAKQWLAINVATAVAEAVFHDGHISTVYWDRDEAGQLTQHGQSQDSVHRNAILHRPSTNHPTLKKITELEVLNGQRIQHKLDSDGLQGKYAVEISVVPNDVPERELGPKGHGYFLDSLTFVVRSTTELADGRVEVQTAFIAGVDANENDSFTDRSSKRHDFAVLSKVFVQLGLPVPEATAQGYLDTIFEISSAEMPNGVADLMRWCDEAKDELTGHQIIRTPEEYLAKISESQRREASLGVVRDKVVEELMKDADKLRTPAEAAQHLWDRVRYHVIRESFTNTEIKPGVFGKEAAPYVAELQRHMQRGVPPQQLEYLINQVYKKAVIAGCGGGSAATAETDFNGSLEKTLDSLADLLANFDDTQEIARASKDKYGSMKFKCPHKGCGRINERPKKDELIHVCQHCHRNVDCK